MAFCHQSALIERDVALRFPYDTSYKICADHHFFLKAYSKGLAFEYCGLPIAVYEISGVSDRNKWQAHKEQLRMQKELGELSITPKMDPAGTGILHQIRIENHPWTGIY